MLDLLSCSNRSRIWLALTAIPTIALSLSISLIDGLTGTEVQLVAEDDAEQIQPIFVPGKFDDTHVFDLTHQGEDLTIRLSKHYMFGENTRFVMDRGNGVLEEHKVTFDRSYVGTIDGHPECRVVACLMDNGWKAVISRAGEEWLSIEPVAADESGEDATGRSASHFIEVMSSAAENPVANCLCCGGGGCDGSHGIDNRDGREQHGEEEIDIPLALGAGTNVEEFEIGVDISYTAWRNRYESSMDVVEAQMALLIGRLDETWVQSSFVKHVLGTVIVRTNQSTDPYREFGSTSVPMLELMRSRWNANPNNENGLTHDLAVMHHGNGGGGLAYVGRVGEFSRYGLAGANTRLGWLGFIHHEVGHLWGLGHSHGRREVQPSGNQFGIMWVGPHERATTDETARIIQERDEGSSGGVSTGPATTPVPPFARRDDFRVPGDSPVRFDVLANDHDANGDNLILALIDTQSEDGGTIELSSGTGPGGRDELLYTPPAVPNGNDQFHYQVRDSSGRSTFGYVTVEFTLVIVDLDAPEYRYDLGPIGSDLFNDPENPYTPLSNFSGGDVAFSGPVSSVNYGGNSGQNALNRDAIFRGDGAARTIEHVVSNGLYRVLVTVGDNEHPLDEVFIRADGQTLIAGIDRSAGEFRNEIIDDVSVRDGSLSLEIGDAGGSNDRWALTRLIITRLNAAPIAADDVYTNLSGGFLVVGADEGLLSNDTDAENDELSILPLPIEDVSFGTLNLNSDGSFTYVPGPDFSGSDSFVYRVSDSNGSPTEARVRIFQQSQIDTVEAKSIADLQLLPNFGQDRFEMVVGDTNGMRSYVARFDTSVIEPYLSEGFELVSAEVVLEEQTNRDEENGDATTCIEAYFLNTIENSQWDFQDVANTDVFQNGVLPWFGLSRARPGFGGESGNTNVDPRADIEGENEGVACGQINFRIGQADAVAIDLTNRSGLTLSAIESILADWVAGDNAGLGFMDRSAPPFQQYFFQSGNVSGGSPVNSTVDGELTGVGVAQAGELGNGQGGLTLKLVFFDENPIVLGDINGDGELNLLDVSPFVEVLTSSTFNAAADINSDGEVNLLDVSPFVQLLTN